MRDEYELRLQSASAALAELQSKQLSCATPHAVATSPDALPPLQSSECQSLSSCILNCDGSLPPSTRNSLASVRSVPTTAPEKAVVELRTENERLLALVEYLRLQLASSITAPAVRLMFLALPPFGSYTRTLRTVKSNRISVINRYVSNVN